jgi:hypothetical protein
MAPRDTLGLPAGDLLLHLFQAKLYGVTWVHAMHPSYTDTPVSRTPWIAAPRIGREQLPGNHEVRPTGCAEGQSPFARGTGGVPQIPLPHPPRMGDQGG